MQIRSNAAGAPTLTGENAKLYDVLKWALPKLGWTIEFDNSSDVIAFRNSAATGTGNYLRIDDNPANHDGANAKTANVTSFASMSDIDTGVDKVGDASGLICKSITDDSTLRPWAVIGDERYFWLLIASGSDHFYQEYYFGDIESDKPGDPGAFLTQASNATDPSSNTIVVPIDNYGGSSPSGFSQLRYDVATASTGVIATYQAENRSGSTSASASRPGSMGPYPEPASGGIRVVDITVQESASGHIRGRLRGAVRAMNDVIGQFSNFETITNQATSRGLRDCTIVNRYARPNGTGQQGVLMFDVDHEGQW